MAHKDYLVVGLGLAGLSFCKYLMDADLSFEVIDHRKNNASSVAGGLYNPIVLKRFIPIWLAEEQMLLAKSFYADLENLLHNSFDCKWEVLRRFVNDGEIKKWKEVATQPIYRSFMETDVYVNPYSVIRAPLGFGKLHETGRIDTAKLLNHFTAYLQHKGLYQAGNFNYSQIEYKKNEIRYASHTYKKIVFAEGMHIKQNPFFSYLPIIPNKGQLIKIYCPALKLQHIVKGPVFIIPDQAEHFWVGSTYERDFKHPLPTAEGRDYLVEKLKVLTHLPFTVVEHTAGIRPTVIDRRPVAGTHPKHKNIVVLNGLGSRGVLLGPYMAKALLSHLEKGKALPREADIKRFETLYLASTFPS